MSVATFHSAACAPGAAMFQQLMLPLQSVVNFFSPPAPAQGFGVERPHALAQHSPIRHGVVGRTTYARVNNQVAVQVSGKVAAQVLRSRRAQDGRIVISGRMRDVCAELDRLCSDPA